jgi:hypothetical protein
MIAGTTGTALTKVSEQRIAMLPRAIGFFFSFRLVIVPLSVRVFPADAQARTLHSGEVLA